MQVNDRVVCVYSEFPNIQTHGTYIIMHTYTDDEHDLNIKLKDIQGNECGTYNASHFMLETDMIKQVLENARNDR